MVKNQSQVTRYNFYQLVELLYRQCRINPDDALSLSPTQEPVIFNASASLGFPATDVIALQQISANQFELTITFFGLHGSQSPLPGYYLDSLAWEEAHNENRLTVFMNLFTHRTIVMLHQLWRKYRYHICFQPGGNDRFSQKFFALAGLIDKEYRDRLAINPAKLLSYTGILAGSARSPQIIANLVAHCFELSHVDIQEWALRRRVTIPPGEQNRLGVEEVTLDNRYRQRSLLSESFILGASAEDECGKFILILRALTLKQYISYLPDGNNYPALVAFMSFILCQSLAWDLQLELARQEIGGMTLGEPTRSQLGRTTFLGIPEEEPQITLCVQR